jgi:hypothetical protein
MNIAGVDVEIKGYVPPEYSCDDYPGCDNQWGYARYTIREIRTGLMTHFCAKHYEEWRALAREEPENHDD